jgi:hypothetical protein
MDDYESAALRHFEDADLLQRQGRLDNAGHLVGFAAECAIKHRIATLQPSNDNPHGHLPQLAATARKHLQKHRSSMFDVLRNSVFDTWDVNRRYHATGTTTAEELETWFKVTKRLFAAANLKSHR